MTPLIVIPARMQSQRLPNKPLADIAGLPMIVQVMRRAEESGAGPVVIAAAEQEIVDAVEAAGGRAVLTDPDHPSGSDRVWEAVQKTDPDAKHDVIVNVQGDLPTMNPKDVQDALIALGQTSADLSTLVAEISEDQEKTNPNVVKAVVAWEGHGDRPIDGGVGHALYFTRATAPTGDGPLWHHIGLYAYRRPALERFVSLSPSALEKRERLEQLRALENGMTIAVAAVASVPLGVDTEADLLKARTALEGAD